MQARPNAASSRPRLPSRSYVRVRAEAPSEGGRNNMMDAASKIQPKKINLIDPTEARRLAKERGNQVAEPAVPRGPRSITPSDSNGNGNGASHSPSSSSTSSSVPYDPSKPYTPAPRPPLIPLSELKSKHGHIEKNQLPFRTGTQLKPIQPIQPKPILLPPSAVKTLPPPSTPTPTPTQAQPSTPSPFAGFAGGASNGNGNGAPKFSMPISMTVADSGSAPDIPLDSGFDWSKDKYDKRQRTTAIWGFVLRLRASLWLLEQKWSYVGGFSDEKRSKRARGIAIWVRETILQLGPTFIKLGQLFSTRADLLAPEFVEELSKLQDRVPAFSKEKVTKILQEDLGESPDKVFAYFDERPLAAASLGQVHRATLRSGEDVVVKVQRPGLKQLFDIDLEVLGKLADQLDKTQDIEGRKDFKEIFDECAAVLYKEIDYIQEGMNADRFRRNFKSEAWVKVPTIYWQHTSSRVLCMEYCPGIKITNVVALQAAGIDTKLIARRATESYLIQILKHGFYQADPHPGNWAVDPKTGQLIFYDLGMVGEIVSNVRECLLDVFYGVYKKDPDAVLNALINLKIVVPSGGDTMSLRRAVAFFLESLNRQTERKEAVSKIGADLFAIALDSPFRFPATFVFVLRAFSTLEGIGKALDPDFQFYAIATPYATELLNLQDTRQASQFIFTELQKQAQENVDAAAQVPLRIQRVEKILAQIESGELRLRARVYEAERADRRAGVMQLAQMNAIGAGTFLNLGVQLGMADREIPAQACLGIALLFSSLVVRDLQRIKRLDQFERQVKGGGQ